LVTETAYRLFAKDGINAVTVELIAAKSKTGKVSLYRHFRSKEDLILAVLDMHEGQWSVGWLQAQTLQRTADPRARLLMIFTLLNEWFISRDFLGCPLIRALLETEAESAPHLRAQEVMGRIHAFLITLAKAAALDHPERLAAVWHVLMKGCIVSAHGGHMHAALEVQEAARLLLDTWPRRQ
jgi:AcrR family transcriptional regulator